ncbi:MAG: hypothetical protein ACKO2G_14820 [Verrucomicrobiales bacterium]
MKRIMLEVGFSDLLLQSLTFLSFMMVFLVFMLAVGRAVAAKKSNMDHLAALPFSDEKGDNHV